LVRYPVESRGKIKKITAAPSTVPVTSSAEVPESDLASRTGHRSETPESVPTIPGSSSSAGECERRIASAIERRISMLMKVETVSSRKTQNAARKKLSTVRIAAERIIKNAITAR